MNESTRIADEIHRSFFGEAWHGPCLKDVLTGISAELAARHLGNSHSIWELIFHLHAWMREVAATVQGKEYESLQGDKDWPPVTDLSEAQWQRAMEELENAANSLEQAVRTLPEERLGEGDRSLYLLLHGIAQHHAYHAGQIALLKKLVLPGA